MSHPMKLPPTMPTRGQCGLDRLSPDSSEPVWEVSFGGPLTLGPHSGAIPRSSGSRAFCEIAHRRFNRSP